MFGNMPEFLGQINGGGLIPVAFGSPKPSPLFSQPAADLSVPAGFQVVNWFGVFGFEGLPADLVDFWNKALRAAVAKPDVQKRFIESGMDTIIGSPAEFKATIMADRKKWEEVIMRGHPAPTDASPLEEIGACAVPVRLRRTGAADFARLAPDGLIPDSRSSPASEDAMRRILAGAAAMAIAFIGRSGLAQDKLAVWWVKGHYKAEDEALFAAIRKFEAKSGVKVDLSQYVPRT